MRALFLLAALVLLATPAKAVSPMPPELVRTTWGWISLTNPAETLTIPEPERYTLSFADGDRVALRADCNRAAGSVAFPEPGVIRFGVLARTHAMCPRGSLGNRFAQEVVRAGRWAIQRDGLRLELSGDAGVLRFTRQP
jgi:heat shock protein HslJ